MGGSQGAGAINELVLQSLAPLASRLPEAQFFHLTGSGPFTEKLIQAYAALKLKAVVHPFYADMHLALGAATAAVCRSGASSLAELAAMRVPAVLIPYPTASDNHQFHNARAFEATGSARLLEQKTATPELLVQMLSDLIEKPAVHERIQSALAQWHSPNAAEQIAEAMLAALGAGAGEGLHADRCAVTALDSLPAEPGDRTKPPAPPQAGRLRTGVATVSETPLLTGRGV
jgi:UDP-N-acetylglucosamine--N-acetylmuramyl-(pentapeptide) pyrophosphoryl-undecaprenol N-acetylglucosamine transferase